MSDDPDPADDDGGMPLPEESYRRAHGWTGDNFEVAPKPNGEDRTLDDWVEPVDFEIVRFGGEHVGPEHLPPALWPFVKDTAERMGVATSSVALACLVACSAATDDEWVLQAKRHDTEWEESPRLWGAIVGPPSVLKSPVIRECTKPLDWLEIRAREQWSGAMAQYRTDIKAWKKAVKDDPETAGAEPLPPHCGRFLIEDATIAAMSEVLRGEKDPDGKLFAVQGKILVRRDELAELMAGLDDSKDNKGSIDRGAYLRLYNGGRHNVDRIIRGAFVVPNWSACLLGGIQPEPIQRIAGQANNDGLLQRFMFSVPPPSGEGVDRKPDYAAIKAYRDLFPALVALHPDRDKATKEVWPVCLHDHAHAAREDINELKQEMMLMDGSPRVHSAAGKMPGLFVRLCLTFHLIEIAAAKARGDIGPPVSAVSAETAERVRRYMREILLPHWLRADAIMFNTPDTDHAAWICGFILARKLQRVTVRDIVRERRALRPPEMQRTLHSIMDSLVMFGWLVDEEGRNPARPPTGWIVNPRVHLVFAEKATEERERRARVRATIDAKMTGQKGQ